MPVPQIPQPRFDRRVYLLLLDAQDRLLVCGGCCSGWTVPQFSLGAGADFRGAAARFAASRFGIHSPHFGSVRGVHQTRTGDAWECDRTTLSHVLLVRISAEQSRTIEEDFPSHGMWTMDRLRARRRDIHPAAIVLVATGYVEGWLPDGSVSLY
ncbi:hypothetical protein ACGFZZ_31630 [Streptomyces tendae]|uniref:hypothetical protein n=1 Tax=Streptomyces tendae TaxID=1932 RepID=UPI003714EF55